MFNLELQWQIEGMKPVELESWALSILQRLRSRQPTEDTRVECKASWVDVKNVARQLAGMANAANGEPILWLIGVDEKGATIPGAEHHELNNWYPQLVKQFDGVAPGLLVDLNIDIDEKTVVALLFETTSAPFVIKVPNTDRFEIPWREGTRTRSATRTELIRVLSLMHARGTVLPIKEFVNETPRVQFLAIERPPFWEYLLTVELLKSKLSVVRRRYDELHSGLVFTRSQIIAGKEFLKLIEEKMSDLIVLVELISSIVQREIPASWGPSGVPGEPLEIKRATDRLINACNELIEWESDIIRVRPPSAWEKIQQLLKGFTAELLSEIERFPMELGEPFETENPRGEYNINLVFNIGGERVQQLSVEVSRLVSILQTDPDQWE